MSVRNGREFLSIPGPTNIPDSVLSAMHHPAIDIHRKDFPARTEQLLQNLKNTFRTKGKTFIYIANGHGSWEAALSNTFSRGDMILVLESGLFANGWGEFGKSLGLEIEVLAGSWRDAVDPAAVQKRLSEDTSHEIKGIMMVQVDTASGICNDVEAIGRIIKQSGHPALFMVDTIASLGTMKFEMDEWGVDLAVSAAQKGLMSPPGLSFNAVGPRAMKAHQTANLRTAYWDWTARMGEAHYLKYAGTPPEHLLFALEKSFEILNSETIEAATLRHKILAGATWAALDKWCEGGALEFNVSNEKERSTGVTTVLFNDGYSPEPLLQYCNEKCGVVIGIGIGALDGKAMRIAHMGYVNAPMLLGTLGVIEIGLRALKIPHGTGGTEAAIRFISENVPNT